MVEISSFPSLRSPPPEKYNPCLSIFGAFRPFFFFLILFVVVGRKIKGDAPLDGGFLLFVLYDSPFLALLRGILSPSAPLPSWMLLLGQAEKAEKIQRERESQARGHRGERRLRGEKAGKKDIKINAYFRTI